MGAIATDLRGIGATDGWGGFVATDVEGFVATDVEGFGATEKAFRVIFVLARIGGGPRYFSCS